MTQVFSRFGDSMPDIIFFDIHVISIEQDLQVRAVDLFHVDQGFIICVEQELLKAVDDLDVEQDFVVFGCYDCLFYPWRILVESCFLAGTIYQAQYPPSMIMSLPVMKSETSEAR